MMTLMPRQTAFFFLISDRDDVLRRVVFCFLLFIGLELLINLLMVLAVSLVLMVVIVTVFAVIIATASSGRF